jgi:hypothetical protein
MRLVDDKYLRKICAFYGLPGNLIDDLLLD